MKRCKKYGMLATAIAMLIAGGCQQNEIDQNGSGAHVSELRFSPSLGQPHTSASTRAGELDNNILQMASAAGEGSPHIVIETYKGSAGSTLKPYFSDELGYFQPGNYWNVNSEIPRYLPDGGMNLYAYFATGSTGNGDLSHVKYTPATAVDRPKLTFTVAADNALDQVDLIAAKVEGITQTDIPIPFRHLLSQINFGVRGIDQHQITIKNIRINEVAGSGSFDYNTWQWTPDTKAATHTYPYYFPDRKESETGSGLGENYQTLGAADDSQNSYLFGDGGKFSPGKGSTFLYAQADPSADDYATKENTPARLHNSLMLLPQEVTKNTEATVTLDYEIKRNGKVVSSGADYVIRLGDYYDWEPNFRYVYLFKFDDPSQKVVFEVLVEPWQNYNGGDGIVETEELNSTTLFKEYVSKLSSGETYSVPIGPLYADFICDWSLSTLENSFTVGQTFTLSFDSELPFVNGKSVLINPPFGFKASVSSLKAPGVVTFTASPYSYYSNSSALNSAISSGSGNYVFSVSDAVRLGDVSFAGSITEESSLTLHYLTAYTDDTPPRWSLYNPNTVVCFPSDYALTGKTPPFSYTIYTAQGLQKVFDWMNTGGTNPGGSNTTLDIAGRMQTHITLASSGSYNLAEVYKTSATDTKPAFVPIGNNSIPYTGNFDGKGAAVSNLYINSSDAFQGFFGDKRGTVQNLNLADVSVTGGNFVGGIAGLNGGGNIINCSVSGSVKGNDIIGGIAGSNWSYIIGCGSSASIYGGNPGGIAGNGGFVTACYSTGNVTGWGNVGGIAANGGTTSGCYSTSTLAGEGTKGGIAGYGGTNNGCYYVAGSDIGVHPAGVTRLPSIAVLNGKIPSLNTAVRSQYAAVHFVSGDLNTTAPTIEAGGPELQAGGGVFIGTFIQNWFALWWDQDRWNEEMALLATLGMEYLVIDQVMEFSDFQGNTQYMSWYPATKSVLVNDPSFPINSNTALELCMSACRAHGIKIYLGTFFDKRYWDGGAAVTNQAKWNNCITTANNVMDELISFYFNGGSSIRGNFTDVLAGWYFPYEVDDYNFQTTTAQNILKNGMSTAMTHRNGLSNLNARKPYLFSPFMNGSGVNAIAGTMNATQYAALWGDIMRNTGFLAGDILSPQDCIGIGKLTLDDLKTWMPALKGATPGGGEFWINVELFGPGGNASYLTTQQIPASKAYAAKLISFSYPIYYSPNSTDRLGDHNAYKFYYDAQ